MSLYDRDYTKLTDQEIIAFNTKNAIPTVNSEVMIKALKHYETLFPNYYFDIDDLKDEPRLRKLTDDFLAEVIKPFSTEESIVSFIKKERAYFIVASILQEYNFGHHETFLIPEFWVGNTYRVDYLIIGKRSGGYEFVLVELEHPNKGITKRQGDLGTAFRKGIKQVEDWKIYIEENFSTLEETFNKYKNPIWQLPREFLKFDATRIHYAVVAGLRSDFTDFTYRLKRNKKDTEKISLYHYENLYDFANRVIGRYF